MARVAHPTGSGRRPEIAAIDSVDRLVRYHRDLGALLDNFVSFRDFYSADRWAPFQAGTLYVDGRSCELCVQVEDPAGHAVIAARSNLCIVYCACRRRDGAAMTIAACVTQGDEDKAAARRNRRTAVVVSLLLLGAVLWLALVHGRRPAAGIVAPGAAPSSEPAGPGAVNSPSAPKPATP